MEGAPLRHNSMVHIVNVASTMVSNIVEETQERSPTKIQEQSPATGKLPSPTYAEIIQATTPTSVMEKETSPPAPNTATMITPYQDRGTECANTPRSPPNASAIVLQIDTPPLTCEAEGQITPLLTDDINFPRLQTPRRQSPSPTTYRWEGHNSPTPQLRTP